jgi:phenylpropionate dioxygenase-like ring-hydroxylating dioxygenase large terminal subunit
VRGLPAGWYLDPARGLLEFPAIFGNSWQFVCHAADLPAPGTAARVDCGGCSAFVLRTRALELRAFRNVCSHRGSRLVDGDRTTGFAFCVDGRVRCPYHGWTYDENGRLESIPASQGFDTLPSDEHSLAPLPVAQWHGLVFVGFGTPHCALDHALGDATIDWPDVTSLRRLSEPRIDVLAVDWKLVCEHVLDTAHLAVARATPKSRVVEPAAFVVAGTDALRAHLVPVEPAQASWSARICLQRLAHVAANAAAEMLFLWPNQWLTMTADVLTVGQVLPSSPGTCVLRTTRYGRPDASRDTRLLRYLHERALRGAVRADARMLERVQAGLRNFDTARAPLIDTAQAGLAWFAARCRAACDVRVTTHVKTGSRARRSRATSLASE